MTSLTKWLKILLCAIIIMAIASIFSSWLQYELLDRGTFSRAEGQTNDLRQHIIAYLSIIFHVFTYIVFGRWIYQANQNVRVLGAQNLRFTPGWAVGYFFVPIFCLWKPYQAMKDLWRASKNPEAWQSIAPGSVLALWWTLWIVWCVCGNGLFRNSMGAHDIQSLKNVTIEQMGLNAELIVLCIAALILISQIYKSQIEAISPATPK